MFIKRTDLALEARELWQESAERTSRLSGVKATKTKLEGYPLTRVDILNEKGEAALGKPQGSYLTIDLTTFWAAQGGLFERAGPAVGSQLKALLPAQGPALVVGLGNPAMTPDAVGPLAADSVLITRHLISAMPKHFSGFRPVAVFRSGVLGHHRRGVRRGGAGAGGGGAARRWSSPWTRWPPAGASGVCTTVQLSDTGIVPWSGVGNHRSALNQETLGVPVYAVGIPTVVDAATLAADLLEESGLTEVNPERLRQGQQTLMVTPRDIDQQVRDLSKVVGYGINWALQDLEIEEINALLS